MPKARRRACRRIISTRSGSRSFFLVVNFTIVTPSFRSLEWLKLCAASVADQEGVRLEHIVQDAGSDDGTQEWLGQQAGLKAFIEKDSGMYDAINRGLRRSTGEVLAYLNCDEQYLPGALAAVCEAFRRQPKIDILLADTVVVNPQGDFICCRKSLAPWRLLAWASPPTLTSSIFFRRRVLEESNLYFDARWRDVADVMWMRQAVQLGLSMAVLRRYTSVFTETGENMNLKPNALRERQLSARMRPWWARRFYAPLRLLARVRALSHGLYWETPFSYSLYTRAQPARRAEIFVPRPTGIWWQRHPYARVPAAPIEH